MSAATPASSIEEPWTGPHLSLAALLYLVPLRMRSTNGASLVGAEGESSPCVDRSLATPLVLLSARRANKACLTSLRGFSSRVGLAAELQVAPATLQPLVPPPQCSTDLACFSTAAWESSPRIGVTGGLSASIAALLSLATGVLLLAGDWISTAFWFAAALSS